MVSRQSLGINEFLRYCERSTTLTSADMKAALDCMCNWVRYAAELGKEADFGELGRTRLGIRAQVTKFDDGLDPDKTLLTVSFQVSRQLRQNVADMARSSGFEYVPLQRETPRPRIDSVVDRTVKQEGVYAVGHMLRLTGERLKFDEQRQDEGVFFKSAGAAEMRGVEFIHVARRRVDVRVPDGLSGPVDIVLRNRGWSKIETEPREGIYDGPLQPAP